MGAKMVSTNGFEAYEGIEQSGKEKGKARKELSNVLLAFSGGASSRAMLDLFNDSYYKQPEPQPETPAQPEAEQTVAEDQGGASEGMPKKKKKEKKPMRLPPAFAQCKVVFIDESEIPGFGEDRTEETRQIVGSTTPFTFLPLKLSSLFSTSSSHLSTSLLSSSLPSTSSTSSLSPRDQLLSLLFPPVPLSPTSFSTLHSTLLNSLLLHTARQENCEVLLTGESSTRLGIKTISSMSQGRGYSLGEEISIDYVHRGEGEGEEQLLVCRPMGQILSKEIAYYTRTEGLESLVVVNEDTSVGGFAPSGGHAGRDIKKIAIGQLVEDFVLNLETQFPSTVSIITKTAHKLGMRSAHLSTLSSENPSPSTSEGNNCVLCEMPAQANAEGWRHAITISDLESARQALENPAVAPTSLESRSTTHESSEGKRRTPYQPSKNHLLSTTNDIEDSTSPSHIDSLEKGSGSNKAEEEESSSLSSHLCYACLLLLQTARPPTSKPTREDDDGKIVLPGYVGENLRRKIEREEGIIRTREVGGEEGLRKEVEEYLL